MITICRVFCFCSAADWYIGEHLHPFLKDNKACRLLRIYFSKRSTATINRTVLPYVLLDGSGRPRYPTREGLSYCIH